jgi:hypothetical protein
MGGDPRSSARARRLTSALVPLVIAACGDAERFELERASWSSAGLSDPRAGAGSDEDCFDAFVARRDPYAQAVTAQALETAMAASPATPLEVFVTLTEPDYDFGTLDIPARQAQLAPYQDPIVALVRYRGGRVISRRWSTNSLVIELAARYLLEVYCWPEVVTVEVSTPYWDAVTPPWDPDSVGVEECPLTDAGCPEHCSLVSGERFDQARGCFVPAPALVCDREGARVVTGNEKCRVNTRSGELFRFAGLGPLAPRFVNWGECDDAAYERVMVAPRCL